MVTREDVVTAYRLILGREPENDDVVTAHVNNTADLTQLRETFLGSPEFVEVNTSGLMVGRHYVGPAMSVEDSADPEVLEKMFNRIGRVWQSFGASEPYWSVLTWPQFKQDAISDDVVESFYATGNDNLPIINAFFARNQVSLEGVRDVLEFGCGIGRTTFALAGAFQRVVAVDISGQHLAKARHRQSKVGSRNIEFVHVNALRNLDALDATDFFYSVIVLQHNPPPVMSAMLGKLLAKVRPGGFALFQVPTYRAGYVFDVASYLNDAVDAMEMHVLEARRVFAILKDLDFEVLEVHEDHCVGSPAFVSQTFFARRAG